MINIYDCTNIEKCYVSSKLNSGLDSFIKRILPTFPILSKCNVELFYQNQIINKIQETKGKYKRTECADIVLNEAKYKSRKYESSLDATFSVKKLENSLLIVDGCNCFKNETIEKYKAKFENLNEILIDNNSYIFFIRGNDKPEIFENETLNYSNIKTIKDYSVVKLKHYNCLCIGGNTSIDRSWVKIYEKRMNKQMYYENEHVNENKQMIDEIIDNINIDCIITVTCPTHINPNMSIIRNLPRTLEDSSLAKDIAKERKIMDRILAEFVQKDKRPKLWFTSAFENPIKNKSNEILFKGLIGCQICDMSLLAISNGIVLENKEEEKNESKKILATDSSSSKDILTSINLEDNIWRIVQDLNGSAYSLDPILATTLQEAPAFEFRYDAPQAYEPLPLNEEENEIPF